MFMWPWSSSVVVGQKATTKIKSKLNQISISMEKIHTSNLKILCEDPEETSGCFKYRDI